MKDTVKLAEHGGGQVEVSRYDAVRAAARMGEAATDAARHARHGSAEQALLLDNARMLRAITYFAMPSLQEFRWEGGTLRAMIAVDPSIVGAYKGGSDEAVDLMLLRLRADIVLQIARRRDENAQTEART